MTKNIEAALGPTGTLVRREIKKYYIEF